MGIQTGKVSIWKKRHKVYKNHSENGQIGKLIFQYTQHKNPAPKNRTMPKPPAIIKNNPTTPKKKG